MDYLLKTLSGGGALSHERHPNQPSRMVGSNRRLDRAPSRGWTCGNPQGRDGELDVRAVGITVGGFGLRGRTVPVHVQLTSLHPRGDVLCERLGNRRLRDNREDEPENAFPDRVRAEAEQGGQRVNRRRPVRDGLASVVNAAGGATPCKVVV